MNEAVKSEPTIDLTLVLACYNEEGLIRESVREIVEVLERTAWTYEVIFVDDGSKDRTRPMIDELIAEYAGRADLRRIFHEKNKGRGGTVTDGFKAGRGRFRGYIDIDLEVHAHYITECVRALENGADVATALRTYQFQWRSLDRWILSKGYVWIMRRLLRTRLKDTETGFKFFREDRIGNLLDEIEDEGWFWDTEFMIRADMAGLEIRELPCLFIRRYDKTSSVNAISDTIEYFGRLWRFRKVVKSWRKAAKLAACAAVESGEEVATT